MVEMLGTFFHFPSQPGFSAHKGAPTSDLRELILQEKTWGVPLSQGHIGLIACTDVIVLGVRNLPLSQGSGPPIPGCSKM